MKINGTCDAFWKVDKSPEFPQPNPHAHRKCAQCAFYDVWTYAFEDEVHRICTRVKNRNNCTGFERVKPTDQACAYFKIKNPNEHK